MAEYNCSTRCRVPGSCTSRGRRITASSVSSPRVQRSFLFLPRNLRAGTSEEAATSSSPALIDDSPPFRSQWCLLVRAWAARQHRSYKAPLTTPYCNRTPSSRIRALPSSCPLHDHRPSPLEGVFQFADLHCADCRVNRQGRAGGRTRDRSPSGHMLGAWLPRWLEEDRAGRTGRWPLRGVERQGSRCARCLAPRPRGSPTVRSPYQPGRRRKSRQQRSRTPDRPGSRGVRSIRVVTHIAARAA